MNEKLFNTLVEKYVAVKVQMKDLETTAKELQEAILEEMEDEKQVETDKVFVSQSENKTIKLSEKGVEALTKLTLDKGFEACQTFWKPNDKEAITSSDVGLDEENVSMTVSAAYIKKATVK